MPILRRLAEDARFEIIGVVTQPDRPVGRKAVMTPPPIKEEALRLHAPVFQFETIKSPEALDALKTLSADAYAVASFGQIIPKQVLDLPKFGAINVHASLLPKYRGASPIAGAILEGEKETGVSIMLMNEKMDHGPVLAMAKEPIKPNDTTESLSKRLAELGAGILPDTIEGYIRMEIAPVPQDHDQATFVKILSREDGRIDWSKDSKELERMIRAYAPWPGTFFELDGKRVKILQAVIGPETDKPSGERLVSDGFPAIACGDGSSLVLKQIQPEGKSPMSGEDFLRGNEGWV